MTTVLYLQSDEVSDLATPAEYVDCVREAYRQRGEGAEALPRGTVHRAQPEGELTTYSAVLPETGTMGGYIYSLGFGANDAWFFTPLFDADTGEPLALIDGASTNPFKTGAAGAVGVDALAREDATSLAIIGSGPQAKGQVYATSTVRDFETIRVYSPTPEHRDAFATEVEGNLDASVEAVDSSAAAVSGADVVITATDASEPVFDGADLDPGTHVTAMGQHTSDRCELDTSTIERSTYVPDLHERAMADAGSFLAAIDAGVVNTDHVHAELGAVVAGTAPGRTDDDELTVFDSGGTGIETVAAASMLYEKARTDGLGTELSIAAASDALTGRLP
ncbi:MAG: ornithine cyclodeaminase family protein [Natronomonas sp.]